MVISEGISIRDSVALLPEVLAAASEAEALLLPTHFEGMQMQLDLCNLPHSMLRWST